MSGYTPQIKAFIPDQDGNLMNPEEFLPVVYIIHDGNRINETVDYKVTAAWSLKMSSSDSQYWDAAYLWSHSSSGIWGCEHLNDNENLSASDPCSMLWRVSEYTYKYGFLGRKSGSSVFRHPGGTNYNLSDADGPLNISAIFYSRAPYNDRQQFGHDAQFKGEMFTYEGDATYEYDMFGKGYPIWAMTAWGYSYKRDNVTMAYSFQTPNPIFYRNSSRTMWTRNELNAKGQCKPTDGDEYRWGFSIILLHLFFTVSLVCVIVLWSVYLDVFFNSRLDANKCHLGVDLAILDVASAMQKNLGSHDTRLYDNTKVKELVRKGQITYRDLPFETLLPSRRIQLSRWWGNFRFKTWIKCEKWWLAALSLFLLLFCLDMTCRRSIWQIWRLDFSWVLVLGVILVLMIGRGARSRWLVFAFHLLVLTTSVILLSVPSD